MQTIGIVDIVWGGRRLAVEKGAKIMLGGIANKSVVYGRGTMRSQEFMAHKITATVLIPKGLRYEDVVTEAERELQVITDIGASYVFPNAYIIDRPEWDDSGKLPITWEAGEYEELLS